MKLPGLIDTVREFSLNDHERVLKSALRGEKEGVAPPMRDPDPAFKLELSNHAAEHHDVSATETLDDIGLDVE
ncbi:MAG: hypothetical protein AB8C84_00105 [Oligoflexales bacterium]